MTLIRLRLGMLCLALLTLLALAVAPAVVAQSTTQGAISGTVMDPTGAAIGGASITITNPSTGFAQNLVSNESGSFNAPLLEPGDYSVTVTAQGFAAYHADHVVVVVGQVTTLLPNLALASSTTQVVVSEQAPVINLQSPDFGGTLNTTALQSIPINNKRWSSLAMETPGVVSDANGYGLVSIRGISPLMNNVEIDGADDNQAFFSEERGRTREAYSTSFAAVREFAVNTGVYSAQYGRAAGGVITSVTKSGTNQLHGQAYFWDRQSNWAAFNDYSTVTNFVNGANVTTSVKPEDLRKIYGFTAGGPLIKDKLFWIYTFDQHVHVFPVIGIPYDPVNFYTLPSPTLGAGESCNAGNGRLSGTAASINDAMACALAARQKISYTQAAYDWAALTQGSANVNVANYPGAASITDLGLNSDIGQVARFGYQEINMPKLDWQINPKNHWSVLFNRLRWDSPGGVQTTTPDQYARDAQGNDFVKLDYGVTELTSMITSNISNQLLYQYSRELDDEGQQPYTAYTTADITALGGNVPQLEAGYYYGINAGSMYYEHRTAYPDERKWQVGDIVYWNKGNHSLNFGVDMVHNYDLMNSLYKSNGDFSYNYIGNYFNDLLNFKNGLNPTTSGTGCDKYGSENAYYKSGYQAVTGAYPCYYDFIQGFGNPAFAIATMDTGLFVQDNWKASPRLTLELGLRWDKEYLPSPSSNLTTATGSFVPYPGLTNHPSDNRAFGPRLGFAYNLFGSGETVLRGGWGMYFGRIINGTLENTLLGTGSPNGQYSVPWYPTTAGAPTYPNIFAAGASSAKPASYYLAHDLKLPEVQEYDLALQQGFGRGTVFSLSFLGALGRELPNFLDLNLNPQTTLTTLTVASDDQGRGPLGPTGSTIQIPVYTGYGNTNLFGQAALSYQAITEVLSNVNSNYNALVAEVLNRSFRSIQFDANYTWSHALDYSQNALSQGGTNSWYDPYGNPRVNYGNSAYNVPNRFVAYVLYNMPGVNSANPLKWLANGWSLDDTFQMQNGLPFTAGVSGKPSGSIAADLNGAGGNSIIPQIGYNSYRYPRRIVDDARVQKSFGVEHGRSLEFSADAYNIANHQNITSFVATYLYSLSGTTLTYTGQGGKNTFMVPNNSNNSGFLYTPRQIEIIGRINF